MATEHPKLAHLRRVADVMDSAFLVPGTKLRVGADGIIGLIPGVGDVFGLAISTYFIFIAAQLRVPRAVLARMFANVALDSAIGAIPLAGDLFDFVWKSNRKNLALLESSLNDPRGTQNRSVAFLAGIVALAIFIFGSAIFAVIKLLGWIAGQF